MARTRRLARLPGLVSFLVLVAAASVAGLSPGGGGGSLGRLGRRHHLSARRGSMRPAPLAAAAEGEAAAADDEDGADGGGGAAEAEEASPDGNLLSGLMGRVRDLSNRSTKIPVVVLDAMVPKQRLKFSTSDPSFTAMLESLARCNVPGDGEAGDATGSIGMFPESSVGARFGMIGAMQGQPLPVGVEVEVVQAFGEQAKPSLLDSMEGGSRPPMAVSVEVVARRRFSLTGHEESTDEGGFSVARVTYSDDLDENDLMPSELEATLEKSEKLAELVPLWEALVRKTKSERVPDHLEKVRGDIGPMPADPSARALWVAALINPLPGMGVAYEIRPAVLVAETAAKRVEVALKGLESSIANLDGTRPLGT